MRVPTQELQKELEFVGRFIEKKSTIPILTNVRMATEGGKLVLIGTDLELAGITSVDGEATEAPWATTVSIKPLRRYLEKVDDPTVNIVCITKESAPLTRNVPKETEDGEEVLDSEGNKVMVEETYTNKSYHLEIQHGDDSTLKLATMAVESFPEFPVPTKMLAELRGMKEAIPRAICAVSQEESRFTLNGVLLSAEGNAPNRFIATDGHRMSLVPVDLTALEPFKALIHKKALVEAARMNGGTCLFGAEGVHQIFMSERRSIIARTLIGNFPDYERVLPKSFAHTITLDRDALTKTIDRVSVMADERSKCIYLTIADQRMTVNASLVESGSAKGSLAAGNAENVAEGYSAGLNYAYVMDFLKLAKGPIEFRTPEANPARGCVDSAMCFADESQWTMLLMPMRI